MEPYRTLDSSPLQKNGVLSNFICLPGNHQPSYSKCDFQERTYFTVVEITSRV